jgi:hypothetical protein
MIIRFSCGGLFEDDVSCSLFSHHFGGWGVGISETGPFLKRKTHHRLHGTPRARVFAVRCVDRDSIVKLRNVLRTKQKERVSSQQIGSTESRGRAKLAHHPGSVQAKGLCPHLAL